MNQKRFIFSILLLPVLIGLTSIIAAKVDGNQAGIDWFWYALVAGIAVYTPVINYLRCKYLNFTTKEFFMQFIPFLGFKYKGRLYSKP